MRTSFFGKEHGPGSRYDASTKAKAIRLVREHGGDYPTQWAAISAVSGRLGMSAETLRKWIRQAEVDEGTASGVSSESAEIRELRRKPGAGANRRNSEGGYEFFRAGMRPATALICQFIDVALICRALSANGIAIAPRTYWARRASASCGDTAVTEILAGIYEPDDNGRRRPRRNPPPPSRRRCPAMRP